MGNDVRFPYRIITDETRAEIGRVIEGVAPMVRDMITNLNSCSLPPYILEDIYVNCLNQIWQKHIRRFDNTRGAKLSTYLHTCCRNYIIEELRRLAREARSRKRMVQLDPAEVSSFCSRDEMSDNRVAAVANDIMNHPERFFTPHMVIVLRAKLDNPGMSMKELANLLGYERPSSLSMMLGRMREIIADVNIEDYVTPTTRQPQSGNAAGHPVPNQHRSIEGLQPRRTGANGRKAGQARPAA